MQRSRKHTLTNAAMLKRLLIVVPLTFALTVAAQPVQPVLSVLMTDAEIASLNAIDASTRKAAASESDTRKAGGNSFVRALKAPFKALGRLFGGKKKENRLERITEKDIKTFESTRAEPVKTSAIAEPAIAETVLTHGENSANNVETPLTDHLAQGRELLNSGKLNEAISELSVAASSGPSEAEANNFLGLAYEQKGLRDRALRSFEMSVRLNPDEPQYLNNLGYLLFKNGEYESATKYLKRAAKLAPDNPRIWNNLGLAQIERGHFDDAYKSFARALGEFKGHLNIATRLESLGENKKAIKHLERARALEPNSIEVLVKLIPLYESAGKTQLAQSAHSSLQTLRALAAASAK